MAKQYTLGRNERLKSRKRIEQLFSEGKSFSVFPFKVYFLINKLNSDQESMRHHSRGTFNIQFGIGVSGKTFKKAVERNRIKRLAREAFRLQKKELQETLKKKYLQLNIFFIYTDEELPGFNITKEKVDVILNNLIKTINENISPGT